ncbi:MAG: 50S ribosomal protein L11 methyltransferase [Deltaproteobacteria bacterium]|nr:50S ribosomal protein L11 methyltransferase [Deltaproteobacteria bacterium]
MAQGWIEIRATGPGESKDLASSLLIASGSPGVQEETVDNVAGKLVSHSLWEEETREDEDTSPVRALKAYLRAGDEAALGAVRPNLSRIGWALETSFLKDTDWSEKWKKGLKPIKVKYSGFSVTVKPTWHKLKRSPGEILIDIDPGMAFGTGGHATTKMCLKSILRIVKGGLLPKGPSILDVGTGTGVLAIAAVKLGFKKAVGTDIDKVALKVARKNASLNKTKLSLSAKDLSGIPGKYDLVAANILAGELTRLSRSLNDRIKPGGFLILSGILDSEQAAIEAAFTAIGLQKAFSFNEKEWVALVFGKPAR